MNMILMLLLGQSLEFPPEFKGEPGQFIAVKPSKMEGKSVQYYPIDQGLSVFPAALLADPTATVVTSVTPGTYRLLAWTALGDKPSPPSMIRINIQALPLPNPPKPNDLLREDIESIWGSMLESDKEATRSAMVSVYRQCANTANRKLKTIGDLFEVLAGETSNLPKDKLMPIRKRIASEVEKIAGNDENAVYSEGQRLALVSMFTHVASILETLK
jgi:hypothetical protein